MNYFQKFITWINTTSVLRPVRAMVLAYSYVLTGTKVTTPHEWKTI